MFKPRNITKRRWGSLKVVNRERIPLMLQGLEGLYDSGEDEDYIFTLQCECGTVTVIKDSEFPGYQVMKHCGSEDCTCESEKLILKLKLPVETYIKLLTAASRAGMKVQDYAQRALLRVLEEEVTA